MAQSNCGSEPFSYAVVMVGCAGPEAFYGSDWVVIDVMQPMVAHKTVCQTLSNVFLVLLVLQVFLTEYCKTENLLSYAPSCSEACLFFFDDLLSLWLQSIQEDS